ncbi:GPALPP motifs-containing protein 1-like [Glandiceps talaboti]
MPPGFKTRRDSNSSGDEDEIRGEDYSCGPKVPPGQPQYRDSAEDRVAGPPLPPRYTASQSIHPELPSSQTEQRMNDTRGSIAAQNYYGPALPPGYKKEEEQDTPLDLSSKPTYGAALPPSYHSNQKEIDEGNSESSDSEEDDVIGPMPNTGTCTDLSVAKEFEARAQAMKNRLTGKDEPKAPQRESWMTELPEYSKAFGLGARTFRKSAAPSMGDRSGWTDTPADKARKAMEKAESKPSKPSKEPEKKEMSERDKQIAKQIEGFNKDKRSETLIDMHTKERKRKAQEEGANPNERRPFDRDIDLQVNRFDDAKKKRMMKSAAGLDSKFSHSKDSRYL